MGHADATDLYDALREELGRPLPLAVYVVGLTALCYHLGDGLGSALRTLSPASPAGRLRAARITGAILGLVLWLVSMNTLSHFATGSALFFGHGPEVETAQTPHAAKP